MSEAPTIQNLTCAQFLALPEAEQRSLAIGVANGRSVTVGLFDAYCGAAQDFASSPKDRESIGASYRIIRGMVDPLLELDAQSLLNGIRAACRLPEFHNEFVISALAKVHVDVAKALKESDRQQG
jgi:hypothetical protein